MFSSIFSAKKKINRKRVSTERAFRVASALSFRFKTSQNSLSAVLLDS